MRALAKRRVAFGFLASATVTACVAVTAPAYGQGSASGVSNTGQAAASTGGNSSVGNNSSNAAPNQSAQTTPPTTSVPVLGGVLGLVLNLSGSSGNQSDGTSSIQTGSAQAAGNTSSNQVSQSQVGGNNAAQGVIFTPVPPYFISPPPAQSSAVSNSGTGTASTGGNSGVGNNSTNLASNSNTVNGGLIGIGLTLGQSAVNNSNGTSAITTGNATAAGNQSTTGVDQTKVGGPGGGPGGYGAGPYGPYGFGYNPYGPYGPGGIYGVGGGAACDAAFRFSPLQSSTVSNSGAANASTGGNSGVGNQSQNVAANISNGGGGLISANVPGLLNNTSANNSTGTSGIVTGNASAIGNQSTTAVTQDCIVPVADRIGGPGQPFISPPVITPRYPNDPRYGIGGPGPGPGGVQPYQLARTGRDPFVMGLVAFSLLFFGLMFMVWERVERYPSKRSTLA